VTNSDPAQPLCIKLEEVMRGETRTDSMLQIEQRVYATMRQCPNGKRYFPAVGPLMISDDGKWRFLVIERGGPDLVSVSHTLSIPSRLKCLKSTIQALMCMHDEGHLLHRDLKPENILLRRDRRGVMLIDMGFAKRFMSGVPLKHIPATKKNRLAGTLCYSSIHTLMLHETARRDDIESVMYTFAYILAEKHLEWMGCAEAIDADLRAKRCTLFEAARKIADLKRTITPEQAVGTHVPCLAQILRHVRGLRFDARPAYEQYLAWIDADIHHFA